MYWLFLNLKEAYEKVCMLYSKNIYLHSANEARNLMLDIEFKALLDIANIIGVER